VAGPSVSAAMRPVPSDRRSPPSLIPALGNSTNRPGTPQPGAEKCDAPLGHESASPVPRGRFVWAPRSSGSSTHRRCGGYTRMAKKRKTPDRDAPAPGVKPIARRKLIADLRELIEATRSGVARAVNSAQGSSTGSTGNGSRRRSSAASGPATARRSLRRCATIVRRLWARLRREEPPTDDPVRPALPGPGVTVDLPHVGSHERIHSTEARSRPAAGHASARVRSVAAASHSPRPFQWPDTTYS
jgi:hypothetical protein